MPLPYERLEATVSQPLLKNINDVREKAAKIGMRLPLTGCCVGLGYEAFTTPHEVSLLVKECVDAELWQLKGSRTYLSDGDIKSACERNPDGHLASCVRKLRAAVREETGGGVRSSCSRFLRTIPMSPLAWKSPSTLIWLWRTIGALSSMSPRRQRPKQQR